MSVIISCQRGDFQSFSRVVTQFSTYERERIHPLHPSGVYIDLSDWPIPSMLQSSLKRIEYCTPLGCEA
jgi:hypothetical protein